MKFLYESATLPKWVNRDLCSFHQNVGGDYPSFEIIFSGFHLLSHSVMTTLQMRASSHCGAISPSPARKRGRADESNYGILKLLHTPNCLWNTYEPSIHWFWDPLGNKEKNKQRTNKGKTKVLQYCIRSRLKKPRRQKTNKEHKVLATGLFYTYYKFSHAEGVKIKSKS